MAYSESQTRTWNRSTANDGLYWDTEFTRIYGNFNAIVDNGGSAPTRTMEELNDEIVKVKLTTSSKTSSFIISDDTGEDIYYCDPTTGSVTATLPTLADNQGRIITIYNSVGHATNIVTVDGEGTETINGVQTIELPKKDNYIRIIAISTEWKIISENIDCMWKGDTHAGYGGGSFTVIPYVSNVRENFGNMFTVTNDSTEGLTVTINRSGRYSFTFSIRSDASEQNSGLSLNTSQGTTGIISINIQDILSGNRASTQQPASTTWSGWLDAGDDVRPHNGAAFTPTNNFSIFTAKYLGT